MRAKAGAIRWVIVHRARFIGGEPAWLGGPFDAKSQAGAIFEKCSPSRPGAAFSVPCCLS